MDKPRFSIVIPTRNRLDTLRWSLASCLRQSFADYEIVVFDNCSDQPVEEYLQGIGSPKVRYCRSEKPLAMSDSWEQAVSCASGDYITVLGDDDGLVSWALEVADNIIRDSKAKAIRWGWAIYRWPSYFHAASSNQLAIPINTDFAMVESKEVIAAVSMHKMWYGQLPMLYNSFVERESLDAIRQATGRLFMDLTPDVYSGFAIAHRVERYASLQWPLGVAGLSAKSNGEATLKGTSDNAIAVEFSSLNRNAGFGYHPRIPYVRKSLCTCVSTSFEFARDHLFPEGYAAPTDLSCLVKAVVAELGSSAFLSRSEFDASLAILSGVINNDPDLQRWLDDSRTAGPTPDFTNGWTEGFNGEFLLLDARNFKVSNIVEAVELVEKLIGKPRLPYSPSTARIAAERLKVIQELEAHARYLSAENARAVAEGAIRNVPRRLFQKVFGLFRASSTAKSSNGSVGSNGASTARNALTP